MTVRAQGRVELCRLELGGLLPVEEGRRAKVLRVVQEAFAPAPVAHTPDSIRESNEPSDSGRSRCP